VNLYYAAFIPGLQDIIAEVIQERLADVVIHRLLDGAVLFETGTSYDKLNFFCFNNIFAVISVMEHSKNNGALEAHITAACANNSKDGREIITRNNKKIGSFRVVISRENTPAAIDEKLRLAAEEYISRLSGLQVNRSLPGTEFWFLYRREAKKRGEDFSVFMKRLTLRSSWEKTLHRGELPPPLAWTLCRLARIGYGDAVLDPFCGYGSIPEAALKYFHVTKCIACDTDRVAGAYTAGRFKKRGKGDCIFYKADFSLFFLLAGENSVDAIITDPPWGLYRKINDERFYEKMFGVFAAMLKEGGRAVVLCAEKDDVLKAVPACLMLQGSVPILLSGKKAVILQFEKADRGIPVY
jgi:predicted RNA methylase